MAFVGKAFKWLFLLVGFLVVAIIAIAILAAAFAGGGGQGTSSAPVVDEAGAAAPAGGSGGGSADSVASGDSAPAEAPSEDVIVRITGSTPYSGDIMTDAGSKTVQGSGAQDYPVQVDTGFMSMDYVSASFMKDGMDSGTLGVQILVDGEVVKQTSTSAEMGMAMVDWYPEDS